MDRSSTAYSTLCDDGKKHGILLPLHLIGRGEGETVVKAFIANALEWRRRIDNMGGDDGVQQFDGLTV